MFIIAGPCLLESKEMIEVVAEKLSQLSEKYGFKLYLKASYKKANRTSLNSFTGIGDELALSILSDTAKKYNLECLTDVHTVEEVKLASQFVDVLQIPAFLARQTDLLIAAGNTGKIVNIKKGQFMAGKDMHKAAEKVVSTGNKNIWLCERGTFFGYGDLVVDMRNLMIMKESGFPVVYDATHSVQQPSIGDVSGGKSEFTLGLAKAATAIGIDGLFIETHPDPKNAKSDAAVQIKLSEVESFITNVLKVDGVNK